MNTIAVTYLYTSDADALTEVRPQHRAFLSGLLAAKIVLASGPVNLGGLAGALIVIKAESSEAALELLNSDPFWQSGLITERTAAEWTVVFGPEGW